MKPIQLSFKVQDCCGTDNQTLQSNIDMQGLKQLPVAIIGEVLQVQLQLHIQQNMVNHLSYQKLGQIQVQTSLHGAMCGYSHLGNITQIKAALALLEQHGWESPDIKALPTGREIVEQYLQPLANLPEIKPFIHLNTKVLSIGKKDTDKMKTTNREKCHL